MIDLIRTYRLEEPFGFSQWHDEHRSALLVEVEDDSGASGWDECYGPDEVTQSAVEPDRAAMKTLCVQETEKSNARNDHFAADRRTHGSPAVALRLPLSP